MIARNLIAARRPVTVPGASPRLPNFHPGFITELLTGQDAVADIRAKDGNIHVSALSDLCPRRHVLILRDGIQRDKTPRSADRVVWAMGRGIERHVREQLIAAMGAQVVVGKWACKCGNMTYEGVHNVSRVCLVCKERATVYGELDLVDGTYGIEGHPDFLFFQSRALLPLEIKSMNKKDFLALTRPDPDHVFQLGCYHRLLESKNDVPVSRVGIVLYVSKDYDFRTMPYREFHVDFKQETWLHASLDTAWAKAEETNRALRTGELPLRLPACKSAQAPMARNCPACVGCFSRP